MRSDIVHMLDNEMQEKIFCSIYSYLKPSSYLFASLCMINQRYITETEDICKIRLTTNGLPTGNNLRSSPRIRSTWETHLF